MSVLFCRNCLFEAPIVVGVFLEALCELRSAGDIVIRVPVWSDSWYHQLLSWSLPKLCCLLQILLPSSCCEFDFLSPAEKPKICQHVQMFLLTPLRRNGGAFQHKPVFNWHKADTPRPQPDKVMKSKCTKTLKCCILFCLWVISPDPSPLFNAIYSIESICIWTHLSFF